MPIRSLANSACYVASPDALTSEFEREVVILNLRDGVYYGLEDAGMLVWQGLREPATLAALCARVVEHFDVDAARCESDVRHLLDDLVRSGLVDVAEAP